MELITVETQRLEQFIIIFLEDAKCLYSTKST